MEGALAHTMGRLDSQPFKWGRTDCVCVALSCIDAMTGSTHVGRVTTWTDVRSALKACTATYGGLSSPEFFLVGIGAKRLTDWRFAAKGDVLVERGVDLSRGGSMMIFQDTRLFTSSVETGCGWVHMRALQGREELVAWRLP